MLDFNLLICICFLEIIETVERIREFKAKKRILKTLFQPFESQLVNVGEFGSGIAPKELVLYPRP